MPPATTAPELRIARDAWRPALRRLLLDRNCCAVGGLRFGGGAEPRQLLVDRLEVREGLPSGTQRPPLDDWIVIALDRDSTLACERLADRLQPRRSQTLVVVVIAVTDRRRWDAELVHDGRRVPIQAIHIVGSGMTQIDREEPDAELEEPGSQLRWSRLRGALGGEVLAKLHRAVVTQIGAGRNGALLAQELAALGVRHLRLVDPDRLGAENLDAMPGIAAGDVGRAKVVALADTLLRFRPDMSVTCLDGSITESRVLQVLEGRCDLIATCVDSDTARLAAALLARRSLTPHLDIGTVVSADGTGERRLAADVRLLLPRQGCVACVGGLADRERALYELAAPRGALRRGPPVPWHQQRAGSLITINAIAVSVGVQLWLELLAGRLTTSAWHRLDWGAQLGLRVHAGPGGPGDACPYCKPV